ncbi:MAG: hypothetical protein CVV27_10560 [Candidatus Melainabacteria bacterium HGW-Melainabacteria-1]|nr:MAG: hypothetical protein CVV27_10560 [Candidatus Melainabacteria bacterium HGW-Melainabacteria-1]
MKSTLKIRLKPTAQQRQNSGLPVKRQLVDSCWHFGPACQRWAESLTPRDGLLEQRTLRCGRD